MKVWKICWKLIRTFGLFTDVYTFDFSSIFTNRKSGPSSLILSDGSIIKLNTSEVNRILYGVDITAFTTNPDNKKLSDNEVLRKLQEDYKRALPEEFDIPVTVGSAYGNNSMPTYTGASSANTATYNVKLAGAPVTTKNTNEVATDRPSISNLLDNATKYVR